MLEHEFQRALRFLAQDLIEAIATAKGPLGFKWIGCVSEGQEL